MLQFPALVAADAVVVAGAVGLTRPVRWVHVGEIPSIAGHLRGQEMVLTTGIALPTDDEGLRQYVAELAEVEVAAIIVGLGPHFQRDLPRAMMDAADEHALPLIILRRYTAFIDITEDVHARLVARQIEVLQLSEKTNLTFNDMILEGVEIERILSEVSALSGRPCVLESLEHDMLEVSSGSRTTHDVLAEWAEHTRRHTVARRTDYDVRTGWLSTVVGARKHDWARLIIMNATDEYVPRGLHEDPLTNVPAPLVMLIERAAATIALRRLVERDQGNDRREIHRSILSGLVGIDEEDRLNAIDEAEALGMPLVARTVQGIAGVVREDPSATSDAEDGHVELRRVLDTLKTIAAEQGLGSLGAQLSQETFVFLTFHEDECRLKRSMEAMRNTLQATPTDLVHVGISQRENGTLGASTALREALEAADVSRKLHTHMNPASFADLGIRGMLATFASTTELRRFVERTLQKLIEHEAFHDDGLRAALTHYLFAGRNKSRAASRAYVSRPWLYEQLDRVEHLLEVDLDDEEHCLTLQVALLADSILRDAPLTILGTDASLS